MRLTHWTLLFVLVAIPVADQLGGSAAFAQQARSTGTLQGRVTLADTTSQLAGVRVRVLGTSVATVTDEAGRYLLPGVPPGEAEVEFSYLGLETAVLKATVEAGVTEAVDAALVLPGVIEDITVTAQVTAQRDALNLYRASDSLTNFVSADDIGQFVDQNVAESLQRLPGISITRDQGEGRFVTVRGLEAGLSTVTINGMRIGTPEDGSRAVPLDVIPVGSAEILSVTKVPTPDMTGDSIGGAVDVRSASAFDRVGRAITYRVEGSRADLSGDLSPELQLNLSDVFELEGDRQLGVSAGVNFLDRDFESDNLETAYSFRDDLGRDELVIEEIQQRKYFVNRERLGAHLNLDFRPSVGSRFHFKTFFSRFNDAETRQRSIFVFDDGDLAAFDGSSGRFEDIDEDAFRRRIRFRTKEQDTWAATFGGSHVVDRLTVDYQIGHSITRERVPDETEGRFRFDQDPLDATFTQGRGVPTFTILSGGVPDLAHLDNRNYEFDRVVLVPKVVDDDDSNVRANVELREALGVEGLSLRGGFDFRTKSKLADVAESELRRGPDIRLDQFTTGAPSYQLGDLGPGLDGPGFLDFYDRNRGLFSARPQDVDSNTLLEVGDDYEADEDVFGYYFMGTFARNRWQLISGVRVETTSYDATGNRLTFDEDGNLSVSPRSVDSDYTNVLPGLHLRYNISDRTVLRAAVTRSLARPSFSDISPRFAINLEDLEIEAGNPDLDPYESTNLDLILDTYLGGTGLLSVGAFHKDLDDYIVDFTSDRDADFVGFEVTRPVNGTEGSVTGFEVNFQQQLGPWAPALEGFLIGANATLLDTDLGVLERPDESFELPLASEQSGNVYLGYERSRFSARVSLSYRSEYLDSLGDTTDFDIYVDDNTQLDLLATYRIKRGLELILEGSNLTDEPLSLYQGTPGNNFQYELYGRTFSMGIKGRL